MVERSIVDYSLVKTFEKMRKRKRIGDKPTVEATLISHVLMDEFRQQRDAAGPSEIHAYVESVIEAITRTGSTSSFPSPLRSKSLQMQAEIRVQEVMAQLNMRAEMA